MSLSSTNLRNSLNPLRRRMQTLTAQSGLKRVYKELLEFHFLGPNALELSMLLFAVLAFIAKISFFC